jgi:enoyl-CoA hydratase/carnithine racemase
MLADAMLLSLLLLLLLLGCHGIMQLVISAAGKNFCAGLDLAYLTDTFGSKMQPGSSSSSSSGSSSCPARTSYAFRQDILQMQVRTVALRHTGIACCSPAAPQTFRRNDLSSSPAAADDF